MTIVGQTGEACLLERARLVQSAVVLDMGCDGKTLAEVDLARDLGIGALSEMTTQVDIDEIEP